jgi:hypothetical protein
MVVKILGKNQSSFSEVVRKGKEILVLLSYLKLQKLCPQPVHGHGGSCL